MSNNILKHIYNKFFFYFSFNLILRQFSYRVRGKSSEKLHLASAPHVPTTHTHSAQKMQQIHLKVYTQCI